MATKKTTAKKAEPTTAIYNGKKYTVVERNEKRVCLTDGLIHFWVKAEHVEGD